MDNSWLALTIGNSYLHWAYFEHDTLVNAWNSQHLHEPFNVETCLNQWVNLNCIPTKASIPLYLASVVPNQTQWFQNYPKLHCLSLQEIPMGNLYPTLGLDRALALYGAGETLGWPILVIDGGTALTLTGGDGDRNLVGGSILPGLRLQFQSLGQKTATLPRLAMQNDRLNLPDRWSRTTEEAIVSGIVYTLLAGLQHFIEDWLRQFPHSPIVVTGGDGTFLYPVLQRINWDYPPNLVMNPHVGFNGIARCRSKLNFNA